MSASNDDDDTLSFHSAPTTPLLRDEEPCTNEIKSQSGVSIEEGSAEDSNDADGETSGDGSEKGIDVPVDRSDRNLVLRRLASSFFIPLTDQTGSPGNILVGLLCLASVGTSIGLFMPKDESLPTIWYRTISSVVGYIYFLCWSVSFYPQVILNYKRKSTEGLSNDFSVLNVVGFACYATYTLSFFFSSAVQRMYRRRNGPDAVVTVESNDVAFAVHAFVLCLVQVSQIWYYGGFREQALSRPVQWGLGGLLVLCCAFAGLILAGVDALTWLDYLYMLSFVKVIISTVKYVPQVILNIQRKSTVGWNIWNIILDFSGGLLSILQLIGDSADLNDWSGITGNPAKFALGFVSIFFDLIFFLQHYVLYPEHAHDIQVESLMDTYVTDTLI